MTQTVLAGSIEYQYEYRDAEYEDEVDRTRYCKRPFSANADLLDDYLA